MSGVNPSQAGAPDEDATFLREANRMAIDLGGRPPERMERLGGRSRHVVRLRFADGSTAILLRRGSRRLADKEARVLHLLSGPKASTPRLLACRGTWLLTSDLGDRRLPQALQGVDRDGLHRWLNRASHSLAALQEQGRSAGLANHVPPIGARDGWRQHLLLAPGRLGTRLEMAPPDMDLEAVDAALATARRHFIKWDARAGNAMASDEAEVRWFDFEHCGCRDPLDDLAWLLGDEHVPDDAAIEQAILDDVLPRFADDLTVGEATRYLHIFGTLHMCLRLGLILEERAQIGGWRSQEICLRHDFIGVVQPLAVRLAQRASRWADRNAETRRLGGWLRSVAFALNDRQPTVSVQHGLRLTAAA